MNSVTIKILSVNDKNYRQLSDAEDRLKINTCDFTIRVELAKDGLASLRESKKCLILILKKW
jgi:hypothetical protein